MRLLLDTNILIAMSRNRQGDLDPKVAKAISSADNDSIASAASLWEIAIKTKLGKLDPGMTLEELAGYYESVGVSLLPIDHRHAVAEASPEPDTKDPFDRLLLAQCAVENMRLVTTDRKLVVHPLAWRSS